MPCASTNASTAANGFGTQPDDLHTVGFIGLLEIGQVRHGVGAVGAIRCPEFEYVYCAVSRRVGPVFDPFRHVPGWDGVRALGRFPFVFRLAFDRVRAVLSEERVDFGP